MNNITIDTSLNNGNTVTAVQLRHQMGEVLERVYYQFQQYRVMRKNKPMARLVNEEYMQAIDHLIKSDPALADTLALLLNDEFMTIFEQGQKEWAQGKRIPIEEVLG